MSKLPEDYLEYPHRSHGMDHERYDWSMLVQRPHRPQWPGGAPVALWLTVTLEWFPLDMGQSPVKVPSGIFRPYPDFWAYTSRDYGNRIGIYRLMQLFDRLGIKASAALNSALAERHLTVVDEINQRNWEIIAHGVDMGHIHYGGMDLEEEQALVDDCLTTLRRLTDQPIRGWLSPIKSESMNTADIVAAEGIDYICDWVNDELPYPFRTTSGVIHNMPHPMEQDDQRMLIDNGQSESEFITQVKDQFDWLCSEASAEDGRIMALNLHPWVSGQPYRIKALEEALSYISDSGKVWIATGSEILDAAINGGQATER